MHETYIESIDLAITLDGYQEVTNVGTISTANDKIFEWTMQS